MKKILKTSLTVLVVLAITNTTIFVLRKSVMFVGQKIQVARFKKGLKTTLKEGEIAQIQDEDGNIIKTFQMINGKVTEVDFVEKQE